MTRLLSLSRPLVCSCCSPHLLPLLPLSQLLLFPPTRLVPASRFAELQHRHYWLLYPTSLLNWDADHYQCWSATRVKAGSFRSLSCCGALQEDSDCFCSSTNTLRRQQRVSTSHRALWFLLHIPASTGPVLTPSYKLTSHFHHSSHTCSHLDYPQGGLRCGFCLGLPFHRNTHLPSP